MRGLAAVGFVAARILVAVFCVLSTGYCLVAYIPFTYQQVIEFQVVSWTAPFAHFHPWIFWCVAVCGAITIVRAFTKRARSSTWPCVSSPAMPRPSQITFVTPSAPCSAAS